MRLLFAIILVLVALLLVAFVLLVRPVLAEATRCMTYAEQTLVYLQTVCDDGTRAVSTDNRTLERWDTTITESPKKTCTGQMNPRIKQVEARCH
jgi:hypothetical protein